MDIKMKNFISIIILLFGTCSVSFANIIYLECKSYKAEMVPVKGGMKVIDNDDNPFEEFIKIDLKGRKIYLFNDLSNSFYEGWNVNWAESKIKWSQKFPDSTHYYDLNRLNLEYMWETKYKNDPVLKYLRTFYNCKIKEKKF